MSKSKFIIVDWMNNHLFPNKSFKTFEEGREFLYEHFSSELEADEEYLQDYYVVLENEYSPKKYLHLK